MNMEDVLNVPTTNPEVVIKLTPYIAHRLLVCLEFLMCIMNSETRADSKQLFEIIASQIHNMPVRIAEPAPKREEPKKEEPKKKSWFGR